MGRLEELKYLERIRPATAVADAMMAVQAYQLRGVIIDSQEIKNMDQLELMMELKTSGRCELASGYTLYYLHTRYPDIFSYMMIVSVDKIKDSPFRRNDFISHSCFLAKSVNERWYMGSPANYSMGETKNNFSRVSCGMDLSDVLSQTEAAEGGEWSYGVEINNLISVNYNNPRIVDSPSYSTQYFSVYRVQIGNTVEPEFKPPIKGEMKEFPIGDQFFI